MDDSLTILAGNHSASTTLNTYPQGNSSNVTAVIRASAAGYQSRSRTITIRPTPSLTLTAADSSVSEPDGTTTLTVSVPSGDEPSSNLSVSLTHSGSATHTDDYTVGTLTIAAGQSSGTATLTVTDDSTYEGNQTIRLRASATGYTTSAILSITLADDDPEPEPDPATLTLTAAPSTVSEPSGSTTLTVSVPSGDEPSSNLTVSLTHSGSAAHPDDYTVGTLTIAAGQRTGTATLTVADDSTYEGNETIRLRASATGYTNSTFVSITLSDDDTATLSLAAADTRVSEPSGATTLTVSIPTGQEPGSDLTVTLTHFGSAANSDDYTVATLTILASQGSGTATLSVVDDSAVEGDETITLVASATGYTDSASLSLTLTDNDGTPLTLTAADTSVAEPDGTTTLTVSVPTGAEPSSDLSVTLTHTGSAVQSTDYTVGTLTIAAGQSSGTATLSVADDSAFEGDETITLVASATGYTSSTALSITLSDDDAPSLSLAAADTSVSEPSGATTLTVSVPAGAEPSSDLAVTLTHSGSATHPDDYTVAALTILAGQSSRTATLTVVDDSTYEGDETIQLTASATGYTDSASLSLTLTDDDGAALTLISNATTFERGENATITIRVPAGAELTTDLTVTFAFGGTATRGGSGRGDYQVNGLLTIPAGLASASTTLLTWQRGGWDDEDTIVIIASATGYTTSSPLTLTLLGDAEPPLYVIPEATTLIAGNSTAITVWIDTAAPAPESDVTVTLSFGGTANRGCSQGAVAPFDYCAPGLLTIAAGQHSGTTSLTTYTTGSDNETVLITATASGYVPSGTAAITINTNDSASLTLSAAHATISEPNGTTTLTVSVPPGAEPTSNLTVSLTHSGTAIHPDDYTVGAVTIQVGQRSGTATLRVVNDTAEERNETIVLVATAPGYVSSPPLSITLEDGGDTALALTANTRSASEGGQVFLTVAVPPGREPLSDRIVTLVHTGSATHPADYTIESLVIPAGRGSGSATLNVLADSVHEGTETITLIASATGYRSSSPLSITVENDGDTPLTLTANTTNVTEGGQVFITVAVPPGAEPTSDLTIALTHSGTATPTDDYTVGTLVIPAGRDSGSATLSTLHDQLYEGVETISLVASATSATRPNPFSLPPVARYASSPPLSLTLEDGDRAALTLTAAHATVSEPDSITTLTVTVPAGAAPPTGLRVTLTHSGTATYSGDYTVGILRIPANQNSGTTTLAVVDDTVPEGAETIILVATAPGYADSPPLTIALHNAEESPVSPFQFTFDQPRYTVTEGATPVPITIRVRPAPDRALEIPLRLTRAGGADPSDYYGIPDAIAFEPGTSTAIVHVGAHADDIDDPGETIQMSLEYLLVGVRSGPIASATIEISQHHTNPHFSASLQVLSALVAQSAAGAAQTGIEARFERHRQRRSQEGNWVPAIPTLPQFQQFSEAGSLGSPLGPPRRGTPRLATPEALLSNYSFDLPLTSLLPGASWSPAIWGQARLHHFSGSLQNAALDYQARRSSAQLGLDFYSREDILVGVAFTRSWGDLEYTDDGVPGILTGTINTFHPYLYWQPNDRLSLWAMAAFGGGPLRISEPGRQHRFPSDFSMFSGGLRAPVLRTSSQELSFKADLSLALLNVDAQAADIPSVPAASSTRSRLLTEWRFTPLMETDRSFSIQADLGARFDGGDAHTGAGAEAGFQIAFLDMRRGLDVAAPARTLVLHEQDAHEWGVSFEAGWDPGSDNRGFLFSVRSARGNPQDPALLWSAAPASYRGNLQPAGTLNQITRFRVGYGFAALHGKTTLTPYTQLDGGTQGREIHAGLDFGGSRRAHPLSATIAVVQATHERGAASLGLSFRVSLPF